MNDTLKELYWRYPELKGMDPFLAGVWISKNWSGSMAADDLQRESMFRHMAIDVIGRYGNPHAPRTQEDSGPTPGPGGDTGE